MSPLDPAEVTAIVGVDTPSEIQLSQMSQLSLSRSLTAQGMAGLTLDAALNLAATGKPVFPCREKRPLTPHSFKDATTDSQTIRGWWMYHPDAQIGLPTGAASGIVVLDLDRKNGKDGIKSLEGLQALFGDLPDCPMVETHSTGRHLYFAHPGEGFKIKSTVGKLAVGIDVRADGGYVIAPPSPGYRKINGVVDPPPLPDWLAEFLIERPPTVVDPPPIKARTDAALQSAAEALTFVSADCDYEIWRNVGMALHHTGAEIARTDKAFTIWDDWSRTAPDRYPGERDLRKQWASFKISHERPITIATLFDLAREQGWTDPAVDASPLFAQVDPHPLTVRAEPLAYPIEAMPSRLRAAIEEVQGFTKAPVAMVASSALAALSVASQSYGDVERATKLSGPVSLYVLTIADSGERKSTVDGIFMKAIREHEQLRADFAKPELIKYRAAVEAWTAKQSGVKEEIRRLAKGGKPTEEAEQRLHEIEQDRPSPVKVPRLLRGDETPENLAYALAHEWPSAGVVSSEAGLVFGAAGMGKDSIMRNLGLLNVFWDGGTHSIGRRTSESFIVKDARLTVALQVQEPTLRAFFERDQGLSRGTGFLARFLIAWPTSTQGFRPFTEAPAGWPALAAYNKRIGEILAAPAPLDADGGLAPVMLCLTPQAKDAWIKFHDEIERQLVSGGDLHDIRDVASKIADNAARVAALLHVFEHGAVGAIGLHSFEAATHIVRWHLHEARRFFGEIALPVELADAARLDQWLIDHCKRRQTVWVARREAQRNGPVRDSSRLEKALSVLEELGRIQVKPEGKQKRVVLNPRILD